MTSKLSTSKSERTLHEKAFKSPLKLGVSIVAQCGLRTHIVSVRIQIQSLASLSRLRIWGCHKLWRVSLMCLRSTVATAVAQASAVAQIQPLAQELPHATGAALKRKKKNSSEITLAHLVKPSPNQN